jgi:Methyltransferase FkbM domain
MLDDYIERNRLNVINFLTMDLEGRELSILDGFSKACNRGAIKVIYFKVIMIELFSEMIFTV